MGRTAEPDAGIPAVTIITGEPAFLWALASSGLRPWWGYPAYGVVSAYPPAPLQYIEKGDGSAPAEIEWFYCRPLNAYFPYVAECPGGWERVAPEAASG
jgi:hypothetical protein